MYKVAIIDDEPLIVEGLSKTMAWEKWNCQVAGTAGDGKAEMVGFQDLAHFSRVFKKMEGMSAGEYRNTHGKQG